MSSRRPDPSAMTLEERLAELGSLFATGYRRLRLLQKALAESAVTERPCDPVDSHREDDATEEVA